LKWPILKGKSPVSFRTKTMQQLAEYLEQAIQFGALAARESNPVLKARYQAQAEYFRGLAEKLTVDLGLRVPVLMD
jgi:hypothetical protein